MTKQILALAAVLLVSLNAAAHAGMRITEWAYQGSAGEYIEFTNMTTAPINLSGWSFDDDSRAPGVFSLSPLGIVAPGEAVLITELSEAVFRAAWSLPASVKVLAGYTNNLGRNDEINIFDAGNNLVDRLTFGDQNIAGSIRTQNVSGNPSTLAALGANDVLQWQLSFVGDAFGSYLSANGDLGNPGISPYVVPEPSSVALLILGGLSLCAATRRRRAS